MLYSPKGPLRGPTSGVMVHKAPSMVKTPPGVHFTQNRHTKISELLMKNFCLWVILTETLDKPSLEYI